MNPKARPNCSPDAMKQWHELVSAPEVRLLAWQAGGGIWRIGYRVADQTVPALVIATHVKGKLL
jgi:hypothetical protein